jgi:peptidoglycan/LPS O-acetylase OafA/YrhL
MTSETTFSERLLLPFRRITSSGDYIREIDGLRFVAIVSVYLYHLFGDVLKHSPAQAKATVAGSFFFMLALNLRVGVELFFVISGFVLAMPFAAAYLAGGRPVRLGRYFLRRVTRLEPPYVLSMLLFFTLKVFAGRGSFHQLLPHLGASLAYLHNEIYKEPSVISIVAWSLEVEVQFYILAPLLARVFQICSAALRRLVLTIACLGFSAVDCLWGQKAFVRLSLLGSVQYFLVGFLLADLFVSRGRTRAGQWSWDLVSLAGWPALAILLVSQSVWKNMLIPWFVLVLYLSAFHGLWINRLFTNVWLTTIGGMCYSIYLLHNYAISALGAYTENLFLSSSIALRTLMQFVMMTPLILAVSALYYILIEKSCMRPDWPRQLWAWIAGRETNTVVLVAASTTASAD